MFSLCLSLSGARCNLGVMKRERERGRARGGDYSSLLRLNNIIGFDCLYRKILTVILTVLYVCSLCPFFSLNSVQFLLYSDFKFPMRSCLIQT